MGTPALLIVAIFSEARALHAAICGYRQMLQRMRLVTCGWHPQSESATFIPNFSFCPDSLQNISHLDPCSLHAVMTGSTDDSMAMQVQLHDTSGAIHHQALFGATCLCG